MLSVEMKFKNLGYELPEVAVPVGTFVPYLQTGNFLFISGQISISPGKGVIEGVVGEDVSVEDAQAAALAHPVSRPGGQCRTRPPATQVRVRRTARHL